MLIQLRANNRFIAMVESDPHLWSDLLSYDAERIENAVNAIPEAHRSAYRDRLLTVIAPAPAENALRTPCVEGAAWDTAIRRAAERASAGNALSLLGDPRFRGDRWHLLDEPLLGFVEIPAGQLTMGTFEDDIAGITTWPSGLRRLSYREEHWYEDERPAHDVDVSSYYIARCPVTTQQFREFVTASGHEPANSECLDGTANHPVVSVTWHDANAYCGWLTEQLRSWAGTPEPLGHLLRSEDWHIALPSEPEWEKAARGTDHRHYPWGEDADPARANYNDTRLGGPSAVGCFPAGASPFGVLDLGGNVWEWTRSVFDQYPYDRDYPDPEWLENTEAAWVLRGGSFYSDYWQVRCAHRYEANRDDRKDCLGFRVVATSVHWEVPDRGLS